MNNNSRTKISVCLILIFLIDLVSPTFIYALSGGQHQTEYISYESMGSTDLVNLSTGDLSYTIPIIEIPGPEGGFQLPLFYTSGIKLDQEASWVGLGWNINPGSINRIPSMLPDDYAGETYQTIKYDAGGTHYAYSFDIGIIGYSFDSELGAGGRIGYGGFSAGYGTQEHLSAFGVTGSSQGISGFGFSLTKNGVSANVHNLISVFGSKLNNYSQITGATTSLVSLGSKIASLGETTSSFNEGDWTVDKESDNTLFESKTKTTWKIDKTTSFYSYGTLYLGGVQSNEVIYTGSRNSATGVKTGFHVVNDWDNGITNQYHSLFHINSNSAKWYNSQRISDVYKTPVSSTFSGTSTPISLAFDSYQVNGVGVSGNITPFRVDIGSVKGTREKIGTEHLHMHSTRYLNYSKNEFYMPQFKYSNIQTNSYNYHDLQSGEISYVATPYPPYSLNFTNPKDNSQNFEPANRSNGLYDNKKLKYGKHIEYATNWDMMSNRSDYETNNPPSNYFGDNPIYKGKIMDHLPETSSSSTNPRLDFRQNFPKTGIGAYSITNEQGYTYHYTIPVFSRNNKDKIRNNQYSSYSETKMNGDYAVHWLLTGITGPDFIDRNDNGYIDDNDWGYWIKLSYGKYNPQFYWRNPYVPGSSREVQKLGGVSDLETLSSGERESYYLNSIKTRTHTALFIKDSRNDGKSSYIDYGSSTTKVSSSLKLDEIILLKNEDLLDLEINHGLNTALGGDNPSELHNLHSEVYDATDINTSIRTEIQNAQVARVQFSYATPLEELAKKSHNSFPDVNNPISHSSSSLGGKLTLESVSFFGNNDIKNSPDYDFEYYDGNQNPDYNEDKFDAWGMYYQYGGANSNTHTYSFDHPAAYSLKKAITPMGSEILFEYERDFYAKVLGEKVKIHTRLNSLIEDDITNDTRIVLRLNPLNKVLENFEIGDRLRISANFSNTNLPNPLIFTISAKHGNYQLESPDLNHLKQSDLTCCGPYSIEFLDKDISVPGGNNRVSAITISNQEGTGYKTRYIYTNNGQKDGVSSGYVTSEPVFLGAKKDPITDLYDFPQTTVLYSDVFVENNYLEEDGSYVSKEHYSFTSADRNILEIDPPTNYLNYVQTVDNFQTQMGDVTYNHKAIGYRIKNNTGKIGLLKEVTKLNNRGEAYNSKKYNYKKSDNRYTSGTLQLESIANSGYYSINSGPFFWNNFNVNTTKTISSQSTYRLSSIEESKPGVNTSIEYSNFDLLTGQSLVTIYRNSKNQIIKSVKIPAYTIKNNSNNALYEKIGSKFEDPLNKNVLSALAEEYLYIYNERDDLWEPFEATIQTWSNNWLYREFNSSLGVYTTTESISNDAYREKSIYKWKGEINEDGIIENFTPFNWNSTNNQNWLLVTENTLYDHYSHNLEQKSFTNKLTATKYNSTEKFQIASALNSSFTQFCFSGAEDLNPNNFFGGEVKKGGGSVVVDKNNKPVHTGNHAVLLDNGNDFGFVYSKKVEQNNPNNPNKKLRASVWVHHLNMDRLRLSYNYYDQYSNSIQYHGIQPSVANAYLKAGDWYLIVLDIPGEESINLTSATRLSVQTWYPTGQASGEVIIDDFRVHPFDGNIVSNVYDEKKGELVATIYPNGLSEKFEYDHSGKLYRIYEEVPDYEGEIGGFKLRKENTYGFTKNF